MSTLKFSFTYGIINTKAFFLKLQLATKLNILVTYSPICLPSTKSYSSSFSAYSTNRCSRMPTVVRTQSHRSSGSTSCPSMCFSYSKVYRYSQSIFAWNSVSSFYISSYFSMSGFLEAINSLTFFYCRSYSMIFFSLKQYLDFTILLEIRVQFLIALSNKGSKVKHSLEQLNGLYSYYLLGPFLPSLNLCFFFYSSYYSIFISSNTIQAQSSTNENFDYSIQSKNCYLYYFSAWVQFGLTSPSYYFFSSSVDLSKALILFKAILQAYLLLLITSFQLGISTSQAKNLLLQSAKLLKSCISLGAAYFASIFLRISKETMKLSPISLTSDFCRFLSCSSIASQSLSMLQIRRKQQAQKWRLGCFFN